MMKNECFSEKKNRFHLFRIFLYKNDKAKNMPAVARRSVHFPITRHRSKKTTQLRQAIEPVPNLHLKTSLEGHLSHHN